MMPPRQGWLAAPESDEGGGIFGLGFYKESRLRRWEKRAG
jgi:hypothetical protein